MVSTCSFPQAYIGVGVDNSPLTGESWVAIEGIRDVDAPPPMSSRASMELMVGVLAASDAHHLLARLCSGAWHLTQWSGAMKSFLSLIQLIRHTVWRSLGADARGIELLKENLSAAQQQQFEQHHHFDVFGGQTGKRYRIRPGTSLNIDEYDTGGKLVASWCFVPEGPLGTGDVMLAQKCALELFEEDALAVAGRARFIA